ncbi:STM3941 family protein [Limibacter armeniacum]|uniref:STM3941 family protein n=1 Tax=Limibacter armeniacum TaxID=466084 RepID=UPI002FE5F47C
MKELKLYKSPWKALKMILLCSLFVSLGIILLIYTEAPKIVGWLNIGLFGLGLPIGLFHLFDRRPQIIINEIGIYDRTTNQGFINWEVICDAYLTDVHGQKFICLIIDEAFEPSKSKGKWYQKMAHFSKGLGFQELNISLGQVKVDEKRLTDFISAMAKAKNLHQ